MPSPFPGMDPFIEFQQKWADFHADFLVGCREQLNQRIPSNYLANLGERIQLVDEDERGEMVSSAVVLPDVAMVRDGAGAGRASQSTRGTATLEPLTLPQGEWIEPPTQPYIQITYVPEKRVVTDIELLSPSNKRAGTEDRIAYLAKRKHLLRHQVSLVELDLLLKGQRLQLLAPLPEKDYFAFVTRAQTPRQCDVYSWSLRDLLPEIPIPLRTEDGDVSLDLAAAFVQTYERGRYNRALKYNQRPWGFTNEQDREWADELLQARPQE
jgi:hypothetical protein